MYSVSPTVFSVTELNNYVKRILDNDDKLEINKPITSIILVKKLNFFPNFFISTFLYFNFLASMFVFMIVSNYSGMIPGVGLTDYVKAPTASLSVTAALGVMTFVFLQISGIRHNAKHYFKHFVTPMFFMLPLLLLDEIIKPASLALRLYGNIFGEEMVIEELYHVFPIGAPLVMMVLSLLFCALQAMVFTMLVSIYLEEVTED